MRWFGRSLFKSLATISFWAGWANSDLDRLPFKNYFTPSAQTADIGCIGLLTNLSWQTSDLPRFAKMASPIFTMFSVLVQRGCNAVAVEPPGFNTRLTFHRFSIGFSQNWIELIAKILSNEFSLWGRTKTEPCCSSTRLSRIVWVLQCWACCTIVSEWSMPAPSTFTAIFEIRWIANPGLKLISSTCLSCWILRRLIQSFQIPQPASGLFKLR